MSVDIEFATVELLLGSDTETRGVDAFALALIKAERQIRKLVTHVVFQSPAFTAAEVAGLRAALVDRKIFLRHFLAAWDDLYPRPLRDLIGPDHDRLRGVLGEATEVRNKIFHGQLTPRYLSRADLVGYVVDIKTWCRSLATAADREIGYDGFDRSNPLGSFRKSADKGLSGRLLRTMRAVSEYEDFLKELEKRPSNGLQLTTPAD
jgi:hypothetical protein